MRRLVYIWCAELVFCFGLSQGWAQEPADQQEVEQRADGFFQRGRVLFEQGDYLAAAEAFALAYETAPHQAVLANLALSYDRAGRVAEAVSAYRQYLKAPVATGKNEQMTQRLAELEAKVADISLTCVGETPCQVSVDGISKGTAPVQLVLLPGRRRLSARVDGEVVFQKEVTVKAGEERAIAITPEPARATPPSTVQPPPPVDRSTDGEGPRTREHAPYRLGVPFWLLAGAAVVAGGGIAVFGVKALDAQDQYEQSDYRDPAAKEDGERYKLLTNVMIGVTASAATAALAVAIWGRSQKSERQVVLVPGPAGSLDLVVRF